MPCSLNTKELLVLDWLETVLAETVPNKVKVTRAKNNFLIIQSFKS